MAEVRIAKQFVWVSGGRLLGALIQLVTLIAVARDAGPSAFGSFSVVYGLAIVLQAAFDLGISTFTVRERAANPQSPVVAHALRFNTYTTLALFSCGLVILLAAGVWINPAYMFMAPLCVWMAAERNADTWLGIALADGDAHINTVNLLGRRTFALGLYLALIAVSIHPLLAISIAFSASSLLFLGVVRRTLKSRVGRVGPFSYSDARAILTQARPYWINTVATQLRNLDAVVVTSVAGSVQAGFYGLASRATSPLRILSTSMAAVMLPTAARKDSGSIGVLLRQIVVFAASLSVLYGSFIVVIPRLVPSVLGQSYEGAIVPLQIVVGGLVFAALASLLGSVLQARGLQWYVANAAMWMTALCLVLGIGGSILWGAIGAAVALSLSFVVQSLILGIKTMHIYNREKRVIAYES